MGTLVGRPTVLAVLFVLAFLLAWANLKFTHTPDSLYASTSQPVAGPWALKSSGASAVPATGASSGSSAPVLGAGLERRLTMMEAAIRSQSIAISGLHSTLERLTSAGSGAASSRMTVPDEAAEAERRHAAKKQEAERRYAAQHPPVDLGHSATLFLVMGSRRNESVYGKIHRMMNGRDYLFIVGKRAGSSASSSSQKQQKPTLKSLSSSTGPRVWEVDAPDTYEGLPQKVIKAYKAALQYRPGLKYVVKMDDDMVVKPLMADLSGGLDVDYLGCVVDRPGNPKWHFGKVANGSKWDGRPYYGPWVPYAAGGMGYLLSRKALEVLSKAAPALWEEEIYEDIMVGKLLKAGGIEPNPCCCKWQGFVSSSAHKGTDEYTQDDCIITSADSMARFLDNSKYKATQAYDRTNACTVPYSSHSMSAKTKAANDLAAATAKVKAAARRAQRCSLKTSGACYGGNLSVSVAGVECTGLERQHCGDKSSQACEAACCGDAKCSAWQWCKDDTCEGAEQDGGAQCWTGIAAKCVGHGKRKGWLGRGDVRGGRGDENTTTKKTPGSVADSKPLSFVTAIRRTIETSVKSSERTKQIAAAKKMLEKLTPPKLAKDDAKDECASMDCAWTQKFSCPGTEPKGTKGEATDDGSQGFACCCKKKPSIGLATANSKVLDLQSAMRKVIES